MFIYTVILHQKESTKFHLIPAHATSHAGVNSCLKGVVAVDPSVAVVMVGKLVVGVAVAGFVHEDEFCVDTLLKVFLHLLEIYRSVMGDKEGR